MFQDALLVDKLEKENKLKQITSDKKLTEKLEQDFNMDKGEASTVAVGIKDKGSVIATDNRQGRKAVVINGLPLIGSIEITVSLFKKK